MSVIWNGSMGGMYYANHTILLWPRFVTEEMAGLRFCTHALSIDEINGLSHKVSENRHNLSC